MWTYSSLQMYLSVKQHYDDLLCYHSIETMTICVSHLGDSLRAGMWQARWKTLGHLSQQSSSPPFWQTAHQSSLGSSSGSALFSDSGWAAGCGRCSFPDSDPGTGTGIGTFSCCRGFDWAPVLLSGRLDPTLDCTCRQRKSGMYAVRYNDSEKKKNLDSRKASIWHFVYMRHFETKC